MVLDLEDAKTFINIDLSAHFSSGQIPGMPEGLLN